ncbi:IS21 family transposase [Burkholderia gladioli]|uniref:IS21 family transposase n=1 Tax=Burkholderia gladioli TaxID=28095 RepID=UPI00163F1A5C|nr:IS21 family transposase [Burkholderia gladioli]
MHDFVALIDGLSIEKITEVLRCCTRSVRNWISGRSPIPWWRIEALRIWRAQVAENPPKEATLPPDSELADILTDEQEQVAWVTVHAPHFLSSHRSFRNYVTGWRVAEKIALAKMAGTFVEVIRQWRAIKSATLRQWRRGPLSTTDDASDVSSL